MTIRFAPRSRRRSTSPSAPASAIWTSGLLTLLVGLVLIVVTPLTSAAQSDSLRILADDADLDLGAAVDTAGLDDDSYRQLLTEQVNLLSTRTDLSMAFLQPEPGSFDFSTVETIVDFAVEADLNVRVHELVGGPVPGWVTAGSWTADTLSEVLRTHVTSVIGHFSDRNPGVITQWDVVSDAFLPDGSPRPTIWQQVIGDDYLRIAFEAARAADPRAELFYDDFYDDLAVTQDAVASGVAIVPGANAERTTCDAVPKCIAVRDRMAGLVEAGVPIDAIGIQMHLFSPDPADFGEFSDWVGDIGLRWAVTEFDVPLPVTEIDNPESLDYQAGVYAAALTACVDDPRCNTFVTWGISDRFSPIPAETGGAFGGALWFDADDLAKPAFDAMAETLSDRAIPTATVPPAPDPSLTSPTTAPADAVETDSSSSGSALVPVMVGLASFGTVAAVIVSSRRRRQASDAKNP